MTTYLNSITEDEFSKCLQSSYRRNSPLGNILREIKRILANAYLFLLLYSLVSSLSCRIVQCLISQITLYLSLVTFLPRRTFPHFKYYSISQSRNFPAAPCSVSFHRLRTCKTVATEPEVTLYCFVFTLYFLFNQYKLKNQQIHCCILVVLQIVLLHFISTSNCRHLTRLNPTPICHPHKLYT